MVERKRLVGQKPSSQNGVSDLGDLDAWVKERDLGDAVTAPEPSEVVAEQPQDEAVPQIVRTKGRTDKRLKGKQPRYPHRVTVDMDSDLYERLRAVSYQDARPKSEIVRDAIEFWLSHHAS